MKTRKLEIHNCLEQFAHLNNCLVVIPLLNTQSLMWRHVAAGPSWRIFGVSRWEKKAIIVHSAGRMCFENTAIVIRVLAYVRSTCVLRVLGGVWSQFGSFLLLDSGVLCCYQFTAPKSRNYLFHLIWIRLDPLINQKGDFLLTCACSKITDYYQLG